MKKGKRIVSLLLILTIAFGMLGGTTTAQAATKSNTHYWSCNLHSDKPYDDMYITLTAQFSSSKCTDVYFSRSYAHWPNAFTCGSTAKYTKSARGTYTIYSSLVTQWASLAFKSNTETIYVYK